MHEKIVQKRGILRIEAELLSNGVRYIERGFLRNHESIVPYEEIPEQSIKFWNPSRLYLLICIFLLLVLVYRAYDFYFVGNVPVQSILNSALWLAVATFGTWMRSPKYIGFYARGNGVLFFDRQGKNSPEDFMNALQESRNTYLRMRYSVPTELTLTSDTSVIGESAPDGVNRIH